MGGKLIAILLFIVGAGLVLYFVNSGGATKLGSVFSAPSSATSTPATTTITTPPPSHVATSSNAFINFLNELFHPQAMVGPTIPESHSGGGSTSSPPPPSLPSTSTIPANEIPAGFTLAELSPYFHWIRFNAVESGEIQIGAPGTGPATTTIDITGWEIKTNRGGEYIPQAANIYDPSSAPILNDIVLTTGQGDEVDLYSNSAPVNLRLNECMGYLAVTTNGQFNPPLPSGCPPINQAAIANFTGACQNYIDSLGCNPVDMSSPQIPQNDYECRQYLENNFTYDSCIANHATDQNFLSGEWHVWMGSTPLDPYHDNVELLDKNGLVVDVYDY